MKCEHIWVSGKPKTIMTRVEARWLMVWSFGAGALFSAVVIGGAVVWQWWSDVTWAF